MITELKHSNDNDVIIELDFQAPRGAITPQNAWLICEAVPNDAAIDFYECTECGEQHMRILLPPEYSGKFADRLEFEDLQYLAH